MYKIDLDRLCAGGLVAALMLFITACGGAGSGDTSNHAPVANAGSAQTVFKASAVTLDGSASSDADGDQLTYSWAQTGGPSVTLSSLAAAKPTFTAPTTTGTLVFSLVVSDGQANSTASTVSITVQNRAPTAMAGSNTSVLPMVIFTLDGTGSSDPDGDPLHYTWTQTQGVPVTLVALAPGKATFTSPSQVGTLQFSLVVNDGEVDSQPSAITITVTAAPLPQALAGMDQTVDKRATVNLVGSGSDALNRLLTFQWQQVSGTPVTILGGTSAQMAFTSPPTEGDLKFSLTVNDGLNNSLPSYVTVHVVNGAPVVATVTLSPTNPRRGDAITASVNVSDPDGDPITLSYVWKRNGNVVAGASGSAYPLGNQAKGDTISVAITASDGSLTGTLGASTMIADTPATIAGNPPTTAAYGVPLGFQVTASDVDGDPTGTFELWYGPAGMSVSDSGQVTWTPSGPLFDRSVEMSWGVRLHDSPSVTLTGTIAVTDSTRKPPLFRSDMGMATGGNSLEVQDFDGDGHTEILVGSSRSVYIVQKSGTDYVQTWSYPFETAINTGISAVASGDVDGDGHREIFFSSGPVVVELDGLTRREIARYGTTVPDVSGNIPGPYCKNLKVADVDGDGALELVCLGADAQSGFPTTGRIYVFDARSLQLKWKSDDLVLGDTLAVGNVDADATLEIVTSGGYVFDGVTGANKWAYAPGFGSLVDIGDVNGDGVGKIVATTASGLTVFDAVNKTTLWSIAAGAGAGTFNAMRVVNLDATSPSELIVADDANVSVYRYDSGTHAPVRLTNTNILGYQVIAVAAGDVDGDGKQEIVWVPTFGLANNSPTLAIASWTPSATLLWSGPLPISLDGPFVCARLAQVSPTQRTLIYATPRTRNAYSGMRVIGLDPVTGLLSASQEVDSNWSGEKSCDVGDVTGSGTDSVLLGTASIYTPYFTAYDFLSSSKQWSSPQLGGDPIAVTHLDVNADGVADVIGLTTDGHLYAWDARNQTLIWSTSSGLGYGVDVAIGDLNGDGKNEIIVLTSTGLNVFTYSGSNVTQTASYSIEGGSDLLVADTDGDGKADIYVLQDVYSTNTTTLRRFNGALALLGSFPAGSPPPSNTGRLYLEESAFGRKNLLVTLTAGGYGTAVNSQIEAVDPLSGATIWKSPPLRGDVSLDSLNFYDLYGDGKREIAFGTSYGMYITQ